MRINVIGKEVVRERGLRRKRVRRGGGGVKESV